ncbi:Spy/CpxP family protein refolding chaperone [Neiella marina]|uniref:Spy/CpxP family protein refolding chaperone n=1 Tax=Neiella holothuriorum TaxID=2870530 RepID=A0ABS7EJ02_9GAMM|nr:Spy/CpxP family protein refolding chaperone [Neiella holothuriorum]MBW8192270.1 Spy/CpxP family protein refolding chaperone [Neiella holothuriorum]
MNMKPILIALCCTIGLASAGAMAKCNGPKMGKILKQLDLTSEQQTQIQTIRQTQKSEGEAQREAMASVRDSNRASMKALMENPTFDETEALRLIEEKATHKQTRALARMQAHHAIMQVLTVEQREQFLTLMEEQREKQQKRKNKKSS